MVPRYSVQLQPDQRRYCVWDNEIYKVAKSSDGREYADLSVEDAFDAADDLNKK